MAQYLKIILLLIPIGALPEIYSYGHRNMQGLIVTSSGDIYENEHGPKGGDEMNLIKAITKLWLACNYIWY